MIFALIRLVMVSLVLSSVVYVLLSIYSRSVRREKLEDEWDQEVKTGDRDAYIEKGMEEYQHSLRRKLIVLVYIVPMVVVLVLLYVINFV
jgi:Ca2+/Na+ antiporter